MTVAIALIIILVNNLTVMIFCRPAAAYHFWQLFIPLLNIRKNCVPLLDKHPIYFNVSRDTDVPVLGLLARIPSPLLNPQACVAAEFALAGCARQLRAIPAPWPGATGRAGLGAGERLRSGEAWALRQAPVRPAELS